MYIIERRIIAAMGEMLITIHTVDVQHRFIHTVIAHVVPEIKVSHDDGKNVRCVRIQAPTRVTCTRNIYDCKPKRLFQKIAE